MATRQPILPRVDRIRYEEIAVDLRAHYRTTGCRNVMEAEKRLAPLDRVFTGCRVSAIGGPGITAYVARRQGDGTPRAIEELRAPWPRT